MGQPFFDEYNELEASYKKFLLATEDKKSSALKNLCDRLLSYNDVDLFIKGPDGLYNDCYSNYRAISNYSREEQEEIEEEELKIMCEIHDCSKNISPKTYMEQYV